jgi:ubiquinone/menaquinone biosynthesis C-methylase UbiE
VPDLHAIFETQAADYDRLVACEDYRKNIPRALNEIRSLEGTDVVELGAGTGRLTCMLAPQARSIVAFDSAEPMLRTAGANLMRAGRRNWLAGVADHRHLPAGDGVADVAIAGWTVCMLATWQHATWQREVGQSLAEMKRVLRPGGTAIILETLGTGRETPQPPHDKLAMYYAWLEEEHGFSATWIRTDYRFESRAQGKELARFFFGDDLAEQVTGERPATLPEHLQCLLSILKWRRTFSSF